MGKALLVMTAATASLALPSAAGAAAAPPAGEYTGRTSQGLPITLYANQAKRGELGREVTYSGLTGKLHAKLRHVATVRVRMSCTGRAEQWSEVIPVQILGPRIAHDLEGGNYDIERSRFRFTVD